MTLASKVISGLLAFLIFHSPAFGFGGNNGAENNNADVKTVTVAQDGSGDYATLEEARDYVRTLDKSKYSGIDVVIKDGMYQAEKTFALTAEDSGTENCPVRYIGDGDARLYGGVTFTADDFKPLGDGEVVQYFPEEVKDKLVQIDLKQFGITAEDVPDIVNAGSQSGKSSFLYADGKRMNEARFPNNTDSVEDTSGWARVKGGSVYPEWDGDPYSGDLKADYVLIEFEEAYNERVRSWHNIEGGYVKGRFTFLWCPDDSRVYKLDETDPVMWVYFAGGYTPKEGMVFYWYHIPEELDTPGEYYIDDNAVLYYYPAEGHETAKYTMPLLNDNLITLDGVEYVTFENMTVESCRGDGIRGTGNHITIDGCTVQVVIRNGIYLSGVENTVENSTVTSTGRGGITLTGGDLETLERANNVVTNNYVSDWSNVRGMMESAIHISGCGGLISHNEICDSVDWGISFKGAYMTCEYNYIHNISRFEDDGGAIHITQSFGSVIRYNYITGIGQTDESLHFIGVNGFNLDFPFGDVDVYGNVVCDATGYGLLCQRRGFRYHDNLLISCYMGGYYGASWLEGETDAFEKEVGFDISVPEYMLSEKWLEAFPFIGDLKFVSDGAEIEMENPNWWGNPTGTVVKNNFMYIDRANSDPRFNGGMGTYKVWYGTEKFADITYPTADEVVVYSSSRGKGHPDIKEAIERASGTISLTVEEFEKIGRIK